MEPIVVEIRLAPDTMALLKSFAPRIGNISPQFPLQSPTEQAARMRVQQTPAPIPQQPVPTYVPQQYQPQPGPTSAAPYATGNAPVAPTAPHAAPIRNPQPAPVNPTQATSNGTPLTTGAVPVYTNGSNVHPNVPAVPTSGPSTAQPAVPSNRAPVAAAPAYTRDQLARAASALVDKGKFGQVQQLFQKFQIQRMDQLPKERYGEFATALRGLGVRI